MFTQEMIEQLVPYITDRVIKELEKRRAPVLVPLGEPCANYTEAELLRAVEQQFGQRSGDIHILQSLTLQSLSRLASLQGETEVECTVLRLFEHGARVYILNQGKQYAGLLKHGRHGVKQQIRAFEQTLYGYGAEYLTVKETEPVSQPGVLDSRYITKKQLLLHQYRRKDVVHVGRDSRLTDSALEWVREQQLIVRREDQ